MEILETFQILDLGSFEGITAYRGNFPRQLEFAIKYGNDLPEGFDGGNRELPLSRGHIGQVQMGSRD